MLSDLRRAQILADARERGGVSLRELSHRFEVSIPTIRRDLSALADQGLVRRVHGGAVALAVGAGAARPVPRPCAAGACPCPPQRPGTADGRGRLRGAAGRSTWARRPRWSRPGWRSGLPAAAAAVRLAGLLDDVPGLTVVTPVPAVAAAIANRATVVVLVGGVRTPSGSHAGPLTQATLAQLNLDLAVVELRDPATTGDALAAQTDLALVQRATAAVFLQSRYGVQTTFGLTCPVQLKIAMLSHWLPVPLMFAGSQPLPGIAYQVGSQ